MKDKVEVDSVTLYELFQKELIIPEYQRPYVWSEQMLEKFLKQFELYFERVEDKQTQYPLYYAGCIVLHKKDNKYNIIDGQQRLTTLALLSKLKGDLLRDLHFFQPLSFQRIKRNYNFLKEQMGDKNSLVSRVCKELDFDKINVTIIITEDEDQAYNFFETLNTGGVRLSGTDILKAHHLRSVHESSMKDFAKDWEKRQSFLEEVNRILFKARKMTPLRDYAHPGKYGTKAEWKTVLTEEFAEITGKKNRDLGYADVLIEKNTHTILSDKYSIRQPLNDGENYINYLLGFTDDFDAIFYPLAPTEFYKKLNNEIIYLIDGTIDLKTYYQIALMCCVDKFGLDKKETFAFWLFRFIYSLRIGEKSRIYEATVINHLRTNMLLERILYAYTQDEVFDFLKEQKFKIDQNNIKGVKRRFLERINWVFELNANTETFLDLDEKLIQKIANDNN